MLPSLAAVEEMIKESPELRVHGIDANVDLPDDDAYEGDAEDKMLADFFDFAPDNRFHSYTFDRDAIVRIIEKTRTIRGATRVIYQLTRNDDAGNE